MYYPYRNYGRGVLSLISMKKQEDRPHLILGKNVARMRESAGYVSAETFSETIHISVSSLRDMERGVSEGSYATRKALVDYFKCTMADLYRDPSEPIQVDLAAASALLSKFANAPHDIQKLILTVAHNDVSHLRTTSKEFRRLATAFLKATLSL